MENSTSILQTQKMSPNQAVQKYIALLSNRTKECQLLNSNPSGKGKNLILIRREFLISISFEKLIKLI